MSSPATTLVRPTYKSPGGPSVCITVPPGWLTSITIVSRHTHMQLVRLRSNPGGVETTHYFQSVWGETGETMQELFNGNKTLAIMTQETPMTLDFTFFHSEDSKMSGHQLVKDDCLSDSLKILTSSKPHVLTEESDYIAFMIFAKDKPDAHEKEKMHDDAVATVHFVGGFKPLSVIDQASSGIWYDIGGSGHGSDDLDPPPAYEPPVNVANLPVGIIGAGAAGLYTAMILDSLGIKYEILEASGRAGGRLYTHRFKGMSGPDQYFDAGAMRYPKIPIMARFFDLVENRLPLGGKLLPVTMSHKRNVFHFNGVRVTKENIKPPSANVDTFKVGKSERNPDGYIPEDHLKDGHEKLYYDAIRPLRNYFLDYTFSDALKKLMATDHHSVRSYMALAMGYPTAVINWLETMEWRTAMFDASLTETVIASLSFKDPKSEKEKKEVKWWRLNGGSQILSDAMLTKLKIQPKFYRRVVAIKEVPMEGFYPMSLTVDARDDPNLSKNGLSNPKYSNVICTLPLSCLRTVDLDDCQLMAGQRNAMRELQYSPSIKIGIQFKSAWWEREPIGIVGGQSYTDRPVRAVVYPSNEPDQKDFPNVNVLIASYNGMQDSQRLGALMRGRDTPEERILLNLVMKDLAAIHDIHVDKIWDEYVDYYPWDWYSSSLSLGAFAWFGPGQFKDIYRSITMPASREQRLHFAGDATSSRHGWVVGALDSAWRCVYSMLIAHPELNPHKGENILKTFLEIWGPSLEWDDAVLRQHIYDARHITASKVSNGSR